MSDILKVLFESRTRERLLRLLFVEGACASESELARRCGLSPRSIGMEVEKLERVGLVTVEAIGSAHLVKAESRHPAYAPLVALLQLSGLASEEDQDPLRETLAAFGAPLAGVERRARMTLEEALPRSLVVARQDGTILKVLPVVLAKHRLSLDWPRLLENARRLGVKAELGMLIDLTAGLLGDKALLERAKGLQDRRRRKFRVLPEPRSRYEASLAETYSPDVTRRWGFLVNISEDSFRSLLEKHLA